MTVPTLLINERQIRQLVEDLEVRYLGNQDANIHYALLTDLPDTAEARRRARSENRARRSSDRRTEQEVLHIWGRANFTCSTAIACYNPQEGAWMGWERKRGKLSRSE